MYLIEDAQEHRAQVLIV